MTQRYSLFFIAAFLLLILSCKKQEPYQYLDGFGKYMKNEFGIDIKKGDNATYYIVNVEGCHSCTKQNLEMLIKLSPIESFCLVLTGIPYDSHIKQQYDFLKKNATCILIDRKNRVMNYQTNLSKPLLIHLDSNGEQVFYLKVNDSQIPDASLYLKSLQ